ncbi:hypothetical protein ANOM_005568 [Aspergillus nomiae NRRL 13137]|uniref:Uncharacterized protein n=1 Tax=Aspergillus nomiae NRRL (strain ATCC 15546 / NRRL 13137 / CBS 260.88 / M93) TaxID=1509407 RepID=A0A0L1J1I0_ASPN3|nr:uncharacterized protein ANOM_005568 [Aspergillus nomiae NRRL 13137]KNG85666.1 hypothetical protein ANOM_005568 [Aspergillus nomiae NRRL 13137]
MGTPSGFGFYFRDNVASGSRNPGTDEFWTRSVPPVAAQNPEQKSEPEPQPEPEPEPVDAPDPEPVLTAKLPDHPLYRNWDSLGFSFRRKRTKKLKKEGLPVPGEDFAWPPAAPDPIAEDHVQASEPEPEPEPEQPLEPGPEQPPEPVLEPESKPESVPEPEPKQGSPQPIELPQSQRNLCAQNVITGPSALLSLLSNIRDNGDFSDLKIKCGLTIFNAHCCIVCPQSGFLYDAIRDGLKEITVTDHPLIIKKMLDYLYREDYDDAELIHEVKALRSQRRVNGHNSATIPRYANAMMHVTADKYAISGLRDLAEKKLVSDLIHQWNATDFINLVEYIYELPTPANPKLQSIVAQFATRHIPTFKEYQLFHRVLKSFPYFAYLFSSEMMERMDSAKTPQTPVIVSSDDDDVVSDEQLSSPEVITPAAQVPEDL